jgi:hypothetical protein
LRQKRTRRALESETIESAGDAVLQAENRLLDHAGLDRDAGVRHPGRIGGDVAIPRLGRSDLLASVALFGEGVQSRSEIRADLRACRFLRRCRETVQLLLVFEIRRRDGSEQIRAHRDSLRHHALAPTVEREGIRDRLRECRRARVAGRLAGHGIGQTVPPVLIGLPIERVRGVARFRIGRVRRLREGIVGAHAL